jgi:exopolysaccharide biosynthesis polyprenyl glycosylphosphotransferase
MGVLNRKEPILLFFGDLVLFVGALWLSLLVRYGEIPNAVFFANYLLNFAPIFIFWFLVFFAVGLYERHTLNFRKRLPGLILKAQIINSLLASLFFYLLPNPDITPKTILLVQLLISFLVILAWRIYGYILLGPSKKQDAILIGEGEEMKELMKEINQNALYGIRFVNSVDLGLLNREYTKEELRNLIKEGDIGIVVADVSSSKIYPVLPELYNLIFSKVKFIELHKLYEEIFGKVPLSLVNYGWFMENISNTPRAGYDFIKRVMDIVFSFIFLILSLPFYPLVYLLIKFDDGGNLFIFQDRVGKDDKNIKIVKFRTMTRNDNGVYDKNNPNKVTRIGGFLRRTHLDEIPQLFGVLKGDLSLVGPRAELPELVKFYKSKVPYYNVRHLIKPGLSGWAQIYHENHPHHEADEKETKTKLSYDLFYIKNRSLAIDLAVVLKTINVLFRGI